jgi:hypothetical protein
LGFTPFTGSPLCKKREGLKMNSQYNNAAFPGLDNRLWSQVMPPAVLVKEYILPVAAPSFPELFIQPTSLICFEVDVPNYGGSDVISVQFNGDTGANYCTRYVTAVAGQIATQVNAEFASDTMIHFGLPTNKGRVGLFSVGNNNQGKTHVVAGSVSIGTGLANTPSTIHLAFQGEWVGTSPITQLKFLTAGGLNMGAGSRVTVKAWYPEPGRDSFV